METQVHQADQTLAGQVKLWPEAQRLMTHPGIRPVTALAWIAFIGDATRFAASARLCSYLGLVPAEASSGGHRRLGSISKQGNTLVRFLLVEVAQTAVRGDAELGRWYRRLAAAKGRPRAKVAVARKLAVRLYWMSVRSVGCSEFRGSGNTQAISGDPLA